MSPFLSFAINLFKAVVWLQLQIEMLTFLLTISCKNGISLEYFRGKTMILFSVQSINVFAMFLAHLTVHVPKSNVASMMPQPRLVTELPALGFCIQRGYTPVQSENLTLNQWYCELLTDPNMLYHLMPTCSVRHVIGRLAKRPSLQVLVMGPLEKARPFGVDICLLRNKELIA